MKDSLYSDNTYCEKENIHVPSGYGLYLLRSYDENLLTHYRGTDCMKKFLRALKVIIMIIAKAKIKDPKVLTSNEEYNFNCSNKCYMCEKEFNEDESNCIKNKVKDFCYCTGNYRGAAHRSCKDKCGKERETPVVFHNGSNYDYHFIIKGLAKEVDGLECIGENSEKYITFKALFDEECSDKKIAYKLKFIDSFTFTFDSLQNLVDNLSELNKCSNCNEKCDNYKRHGKFLIHRCNKCKKR